MLTLMVNYFFYPLLTFTWKSKNEILPHVLFSIHQLYIFLAKFMSFFFKIYFVFRAKFMSLFFFSFFYILFSEPNLCLVYNVKQNKPLIKPLSKAQKKN